MYSNSKTCIVTQKPKLNEHMETDKYGFTINIKVCTVNISCTNMNMITSKANIDRI